MRYFAGIGSRQTPPQIKKTIIELCVELINNDYILRSGGAEGADSFFEYAYDTLNGYSEIFFPWKNFNNHLFNTNKKTIINNPTNNAMEIAKKYHPNWLYLSYGAKKLHARNSHQVLGLDLNTPVDFVIFWQNPSKKGGTQQALRIARDYNITCYNLFYENSQEQLYNYLREN